MDKIEDVLFHATGTNVMYHGIVCNCWILSLTTTPGPLSITLVAKLIH